MKLSQEYLKQIIKEEYSRLLNEVDSERQEEFAVPIFNDDKKEIAWHRESINISLPRIRDEKQKKQIENFMNSSIRQLLTKYNVDLSIKNSGFKFTPSPEFFREFSMAAKTWGQPKVEISLDKSQVNTTIGIIPKDKLPFQKVYVEIYPNLKKMKEDLEQIVKFWSEIRQGKIKTISLY